MNERHCIVLTLKEWSNWIEHSLLRVDLNRVKTYNSTQNSMNSLFSSTPDITFKEDNEFIIAGLVNDYSCHINPSKTSGSYYLGLDSVKSFYAVSERGAKLLTHTASNLQTELLTDPAIENIWNTFCEQQKEEIKKSKAIKLLKILELIHDLHISDTKISLEYLEEFKVLSEESDSLDIYENTKSYGGMATRLLVVGLGSKIGDSTINDYKELSKEIDCQKSYIQLQKLQTYKDLTETFFSQGHINIIEEKIKTEEIITKSGSEPVPLLALSLYLHYEMLLNSQIEVNLSSLKFDLEILKYCYTQKSENTHITVAYLLGQLYPDIMINSLYAAKTKKASVMNMEYLESLKPKLPILDQEKFDALTKNLRIIIEIPQAKTADILDTATELPCPSPSEEVLVVTKKDKLGASDPYDCKAENGFETSNLSTTGDSFGKSNESDSTESVKPHHPQPNLSEQDKALLAIKDALSSEKVIKDKTWTNLLTELKKQESKLFIELKGVKEFKEKLQALGLEGDSAGKNLSTIFDGYKIFIENK